MFKRILIFTLLMTLLSTVAYADGWKAVADPNSGSVLAIGKSCEPTGGDVFITVVYPGADTGDLTADLSAISYLKALPRDAYGNFSLSYTLSNVVEGVYQVSVNDGCGFDGHQSSFAVLAKSDVNEALTAWNNLSKSANKSVADYETFLGDNQSVFGIVLGEEYDACDKQKLWEKMKAEAPYSSNLDVFKQFYSLVSILSMDKKSTSAVADALGEYVLLAEPETLAAWSELDEAGLKRLYSKVQKMTIDPKTFDREIKEMLIVEHFNSAGRSNIKEVMEEYASEVGIKMNAGSDFSKLKNTANVYVKMANRSDFSSYSEIKQAFDEFVRQEAKDEQSGSTGGGGGSSSSGGASVSIVRNPSSDAVATEPPAGRLSPFTDLDEAIWAMDSIEYLYSKGIINGVSATEFRPNNNVTREEFVKMLVLAFDMFDGTYQNEFQDVSPDAWYAPYVASAVKHGIVMGIGNGKFGVGSNITREDMAVMLFRILPNVQPGFKALSGSEFSDSELIAPYAKEAVDTLSSLGIVNGIGDGRFAPKVSLTRAMAATVIARIISK